MFDKSFFIALTVTLLLCVIAIIWAIKVGDKHGENGKARYEGAAVSSTDYYYGSLLTVEHDDHWFVVQKHNYDAPIHHPSCPCKNKAEKE